MPVGGKSAAAGGAVDCTGDGYLIYAHESSSVTRALSRLPLALRRHRKLGARPKIRLHEVRHRCFVNNPLSAPGS